MKIYLSGPITGIENYNKQAFIDAYNRLKTNDNIVINPLGLDHSKCEKWEDYMKVDIKALLDCDKIVMLKGFENSKGAMIELEIAGRLGIEVEYFSNNYRKEQGLDLIASSIYPFVGFDDRERLEKLEKIISKKIIEAF